VQCHDCEEPIDEDEIVRVKVGRKTLKLCEDCSDIRREEAEVAGAAMSAMQDMMEYKGR
jgi:hypothetical protein